MPTGASVVVKYEYEMLTNLMYVAVLLVGVLVPAGLIAVTLHTYWSHSDVESLVVMLSLLIVMVVEEVLNIVMVLMLVHTVTV